MKEKKTTSINMLLSSAFMFSLALLVFIGVTFAWFAIGAKVGDIDIIVAPPNVDSDLYYEDGSGNWVLSNVSSNTAGSFEFVDIVPNQYFHYRLELLNTGSIDTVLTIDFKNIVCSNTEVADCVANRMQIKDPHLYSATYNAVDDLYVKGTEITHPFAAKDKYLNQATESNLNIFTYSPFIKQQALIIEFYLWFNPTQAYDLTSGQVVTEENSNSYINSQLKITSVYITIEQIKDEIPTWD